MTNKQRRALAQFSIEKRDRAVKQAEVNFNKTMDKMSEVDRLISNSEEYFYTQHPVLGLVISDREGNLYDVK